MKKPGKLPPLNQQSSESPLGTQSKMHSTHEDLKRDELGEPKLSQNGSTDRVSKASKQKSKQDKEAAI